MKGRGYQVVTRIARDLIVRSAARAVCPSWLQDSVGDFCGAGPVAGGPADRGIGRRGRPSELPASRDGPEHADRLTRGRATPFRPSETLTEGTSWVKRVGIALVTADTWMPDASPSEETGSRGTIARMPADWWYSVEYFHRWCKRRGEDGDRSASGRLGLQACLCIELDRHDGDDGTLLLALAHCGPSGPTW